MTDVDVIIVNYLSGEEACQAARSVAACDTHIWVVDNSGEVLADPPPGVTTLGDGSNRMYAPASNLAFVEGASELVLLLNPDVMLDSDGLGELVAAIDADRSLWAVAPALVSTDGASQPYLRRLPTARSLLADFVPPLRRVFARDYDRYLCVDLDQSLSALVEQPAAACLLLRRSRAGPVLFDEQFRLFFNDVDLSRRMAEAGWDCRYLPSVRATHIGGLSIERERDTSGTWVSDEYDAAALRYARSNFRLGGAFVVVVTTRRVLRSLHYWWRRTTR